MRLIRNVAIVIVLAVIVVVALRGANPDGVTTAQESELDSLIQDETVVMVDDLDVTVNATGTIEPVREVDLAFELTGFPVQEILVEEGQWVEQGTVLARLDAADLETALRNAEVILDMQRVSYDALTAPPREVDIAVAEAALAAAQASVNAAFDAAPSATEEEIARLQQEIAKNRLWQQQLQRDQVVDPYVPEGIPESFIPQASDETRRQLEAGLSQADYEVLVAQANLNSTLNRGPDVGGLGAANASVINAQIQLNRLLDGPSEYDMQRAQIGLLQAELALEQARTSLGRTVLSAPFDGVVAQSNLTVGERPSGTAAFQLVDNNAYYVYLLIDETEIADVQVGQPVSLVVDALPEASITGQVTRVAQTPTRLGQVVTYVAQVELDPTLEPVRIGMNTTATISVQQLEDVMVLRNRFIRIDRATQKAYVTIQREAGHFEEVEVQLGLRNDTHSQILNGLQAGQRVVLLPRDELNPFETGRP